METEALRIFVDVMRRGSYAAVARERDVDPSSVSRTIAGLEQLLGVRLFNRTTRSLSPTAAALAYFDRVEPIVDELERASLIARDSGDTPRGVLRITAPVTFAQINLVPLLPELSSRYPELSFELLLSDTLLDLVEARVDVAVRIGPLAESTLIAHRLCGLIYVACASPDYLARRGPPKTPAELQHHECLRYPVTGYGAKWRFREGDRVTEVPVRGRVVAANFLALKQCAVGGMGVLLVPRWCVAGELQRGALVDLFPGCAATVSEFDTAAWVLYPSRSYLPRKVRAFVDFLKEKFENGAPAEASLSKSVPSRRGRRGSRRPARRRAPA
jgi:DNA-binding transcriptional LysR family regulator